MSRLTTTTSFLYSCFCYCCRCYRCFCKCYNSQFLMHIFANFYTILYTYLFSSYIPSYNLYSPWRVTPFFWLVCNIFQFSFFTLDSSVVTLSYATSTPVDTTAIYSKMLGNYKCTVISSLLLLFSDFFCIFYIFISLHLKFLHFVCLFPFWFLWYVAAFKW